MTNESEELTISERRPGGASYSAEAPAMPCINSVPGSPGHYNEREEQEVDDEAIELFVAMGNAAKAARGLSFECESTEPSYATTTTTATPAAATNCTTINQGVWDNITGRNGSSNNTTTATTTVYDLNGQVVCYEETTITSTSYCQESEQTKNETCTLTGNGREERTTTTLHSITTTDGSGVDDEDDYVVQNSGEEVDRGYKMCGTERLAQSEHIIQQQQQHPEQGRINALISNVSLFLDQTWNWLHYFLVTIIFLNLVRFADRRHSVVGKEHHQASSGLAVGGDELKVDQNFVETEQEQSVGNGDSESVDNLLSNLLEENCEKGEKMSPNTCSIQNQEVEKAEEAIMAVGIAPQAEEKGELAPVEDKVVPVVEIEEIKEQPEEEEEEKQQQQQQITIILPRDDQVVVVSGEEVASSSSDENSSDMAGIDRRDSVDSYASSEGSGNLGDVETEICDKSSEDGSSTTGGADEGEMKEETTQKIIAQVEAMFSDEHLAKDGFLLKHVRRRSDGFVSLKLVAGLRKVKQLSREFPVVLTALKDSTKLEINPEGTKVRRVEPLTAFLKAVPIKSKEKETKSKDASSNDENSQPATHQNKSASKSGNKENGNDKQFNNNSNYQNNQSRRNSNAAGGNQSRRNSNSQQGGNNHHRKSSNTSTASSNNSSRHNSFSKAPGAPGAQHPADLFRNVYMAAYSSSGEESQSPQVGRRRGGSLPIAALHRASQQNAAAAGAYLSPNSSPPNGTLVLGPNGARPKSNSYCEGASPTTMSPWLQRRKASASSRLSNGELSFNGVLRQPRGPDGTKGFANGYRAMILEERLQQTHNSAVSA